MLDALLDSLGQVLSWPTFGYLLVGLLIGFVVGLLPGLGATGAMALMLPFTLTMAPVEAFAFLLGMYTVTTIAGDITSVIFGIPGEPTTIALVVDGYPMTKRGEAGRALGAALFASLIGVFIGALVLLALIPLVGPLIGVFGSPEYFVLAILGLAFIASVSGRAPLRGLIAGAVGILLAMIGQDPQLGTPRYTGGFLELYDGLNVVPIALGLYAIPEMLSLILSGTSISRRAAVRLGGVAQGFKDVFQHRRIVASSGVLGAVIGMVPGLGGVVAQWVAYGNAARRAGPTARFGTGDVRGVIAPAAASNSKEGGNLLALVAFGLPSQATMAILLGAFLIQGLVPGPEMLGIHLDVTLSMIWTMIIASTIALVICLVFLKYLVRVVEVPGSILVPILLMLVFLGAYAEESSSFDLYVAVVFGVVGVLMIRFDYPRPPLILGFIIGAIAERNFLLASQRYGWNWLERPAVQVLLALLLLATAWTLGRRAVRAGAARRTASAAEKAAEPAEGQNK